MKIYAVIAILLLLACLAPASLAEGLSLHVAPAGSDDHPGTEAQPLQTIEAAIAKHRKEAGAEGSVIWLHGGEYVLTEPLSLTYRDKKPLAICAAPGETPVLTGAVRIDGWAEVTLSGGAVWAAQVDAKALRALYRDQGACTPARWPKEGMLRVAGAEKRDAAQPSSATQAQHRAFYVTPEDIPIDILGAYVRVPHFWKDELTGVKSYDAATGRLSLNRRTSMTVAADDRYWFENVLGAPLEPGEWAFDAESKTVYYAPLPGELIDETAIYAGLYERLLTVDGAANLSFEGVTFARTGWSIPLRDAKIDFPQAAMDVETAVYVQGTKNIAFDRCVFRDIGGGCIQLDYNVKDASVTRCTFENIGAQAMHVHGKNLNGDPNATERLTVEDNTIRGFGRNFFNAPAILLIHVRSADIRYNEISDGYYTGISVGWVWGSGFNVTDYIAVENNLIYDIGQGMLSDMGGIYLLGVQRHTVISGNVIHDVHADDYGGWGIYLDEGAGYVTVENNLVYRCSAQGFHQHNGVTNTVRNNIFAHSLAGQIGASDKRAAGTFVLEGNILAGEEPFFYRKYGKEKIDERENLFFTDASPFVNADAGDYALIDGLSLDSIGFSPWTYEAGVRPYDTGEQPAEEHQEEEMWIW